MQNTSHQTEPEVISASQSERETTSETQPVETLSSEEERDRFLLELEKTLRKENTSLTRFLGLYLLGSLLCLLSCLLLNFTGSDRFVILSLLGSGSILGSFMFMIQLAINRSRNVSVLERLDKCEDVRAISKLLNFVTASPPPEQFLRVLTKLLPRMKASDADLLTGKQRWLLARFLRQHSRLTTKKESVEFALAILKALEQIGDRSFLPIVERLAEQPANTPDGKRIREAATGCLPALRLLVEERRTEEELLRPANAKQNDPEQLLRAARNGSASEPTELLRARDSDEGSTTEKNVRA